MRCLRSGYYHLASHGTGNTLHEVQYVKNVSTSVRLSSRSTVSRRMGRIRWFSMACQTVEYNVEPLDRRSAFYWESSRRPKQTISEVSWASGRERPNWCVECVSVYVTFLPRYWRESSLVPGSFNFFVRVFITTTVGKLATVPGSSESARKSRAATFCGAGSLNSATASSTTVPVVITVRFFCVRLLQSCTPSTTRPS